MNILRCPFCRNKHWWRRGEVEKLKSGKEICIMCARCKASFQVKIGFDGYFISKKGE